MPPERFVLHLSGHACSGKSTVADALAERLPGLYVVSYDRLKWQLAGYDRTKDGPLVDDLVLGFFEVVCRRHIPVLLDFYFETEAGYTACRAVAEREGYAFADVELTAPLPVLLQRFRQRVADAARTGAKISVTDEAVFLRNAERVFFLPPGSPRFDTSTTDIDAIVDGIL
ncbi:MAG: AAA family ATPase, partial [Thermoanaerobaculia bacterium]